MKAEKIFLSSSLFIFAVALCYANTPEDWRKEWFVVVPLFGAITLLFIFFLVWILFLLADIPIGWVDKFFGDIA